MPHTCRMLWFIVMGLTSGVDLVAQDTIFEDTVSLEPGSRLELETTRGTVHMSSWDESRVEIRARIAPPPGVDPDYAQRAVDGTTIEVRGSRRSMRIRTNYRGVPRRVGRVDGFRAVPLVHYEIRAPRQVDLDLDVDRSDTTLDGFEGNLLLNFDRSDLRVTDLTGTITLALDRGALVAHALSGSIALDVDRSREVSLDGVHGGIHFDLDRTNATMHGVQIDADSAVTVDRGDLDLHLVGTQPLTINVSVSRRGEVSSNLPALSRSRGNDYHGSLNGGGPLLQIEADRSEIRLATE